MVPVTSGFRDCERSSSVVIFGYLDGFCDHKVSNDHQLNATTDDLARWDRVASPRPCIARPHASLGAALDGTGACAIPLCPQAGVW